MGKVRGKTVTMYLMDGTPNGAKKVHISNWTGVVYVFNRTQIDFFKDRDDLDKASIYMLIGEGGVYIGQASIRFNNRSLSQRLEEHREKDFDWHTVIFVTTFSDDYLGATELNYLENRLYNISKDAGRVNVFNRKEPSVGSITEEKRDELDDFIDHVEILVGVLGYPYLTHMTEEDNLVEDKEELLILTRNGYNALGYMTKEGFVLKAHSLVATSFGSNQQARRLEEIDYYVLNKDKIDPETNRTTEDILFKTPSSASNFVNKNVSNGWTEWKNKDGIPLRDLGYR